MSGRFAMPRLPTARAIREPGLIVTPQFAQFSGNGGANVRQSLRGEALANDVQRGKFHPSGTRSRWRWVNRQILV